MICIYLQAVHCIRGRKLLYDYCNEHAIPHKQIGKLIVATVASDVPKLNDLLKRGIENGVGDLRMLDASEAMVMEPELHCVKAIFSPSSGIVDSHSLMLSLVVCTSIFLQPMMLTWEITTLNFDCVNSKSSIHIHVLSASLIACSQE